MLFLPRKSTFFIEKWEVDPLHNKICSGAEQHDVEPKAMQILECLARNAGKTVHRDDLFKTVWPNQKVTEEALTRAIGHLRQCFADAPKSPHYIATIHKIGYRMIAKVSSGNYFKKQALGGRLPYFSKTVNAITKVAVFSLTTSLVYLIFDQPVVANLSKIKVKYITSDLGMEMGQALSPDGLNIVYKKLITSKNEPGVTDGTYISALFVKNIASHRIERLSQPKGKASHPVWSPDNRHIAFGHEVPNSESKMQYGIYSIDVITGTHKLHVNTSAHNHGLSWSADGQYIIYTDGSNDNEIRHLYRVDVNTNRYERLAPTHIENSDVIYSYPKSSPNGAYIAVIRTDPTSRQMIDLVDTKDYLSANIYSTETGISSIEWKDNSTLFVVDGPQESKRLFELSIADGKVKTIPVEDKDIEYLSYSQTSNRLTFESIKQPFNIYSTNFTTDYRLLETVRHTQSNKKELEATESSDGEYTAIISSRDGTFEVWLKQNSSQQTQKLTSIEASSMRDLDWSPDNNILSFIASTAYQKDALYWIDINSRKIEMFSFGESRYSLIGWEENYSFLFTSDYKDEWKLWRLNIRTKIAELAADGPISYGRLSPDRKVLYLTKHEQAGIWSTDVKNIRPVKISGTEKVGMNRSWAATESGLLYFVYGDVGGYDNLYLFDFKTSKTERIAQMNGIYLNRINWVNNRLYYTLRERRESDIALIENL